MLPIAVLTSDKYLPSLRGFAYLFNKYWDEKQEVSVIGFTAPDFDLPSNFRFFSIGTMSNYPIQRWSNALMDFLRRYNKSHFVLMLEDYWLRRKVNCHAVHSLYQYAKQHDDILKIDLCADRLYAMDMTDLCAYDYMDLVLSSHNSPYQMSLMTGIWNRELLSRVLIPNETPWEVEIAGTARLAAMPDLRVIGTRQWPIRHTLAHRGGDGTTYLVDELQEEDRNALKELGYIR